MFFLLSNVLIQFVWSVEPDSTEKTPEIVAPATQTQKLAPIVIDATYAVPVEEELPPTTEELLQQVLPSGFDIPMVYTEEVVYWVEFFSNSGRWTASKWIRESGKYRNYIQAELKKNNMPQDLLYLAMIESGFDPTATSSAQAAGIWQFMPDTARQYGLVVNDVIDERLDPIRSTQAAIAYLQKLHREFANWHVAMAAYNAGEAKLYKAIGEQGTINYWELIHSDSLSGETKDYVPRVLAMAILDKNPDLFGVPSTNAKTNPIVVKQVTAQRNAHIATLAEAAGITTEQFLSYNPHILRERLLIEQPEIVIYLPPMQAEKYILHIRRTQTDRFSSGRSLSKEELQQMGIDTVVDTSLHKRNFTYTIQENDTWEIISTKEGITVQDLQTWNPTVQVLSVGGNISLQAPKKQQMKRHVVGASETLESIAKKYSCSVEDLRMWNGLEEDATISKDDIVWIQ